MKIKEIHYLIGNNCNLNCDFCFWDMRMSDVPLSFKKKIVDQIADSRVRLVTLSGGDPLCSGDFLKILKYMHSKGLEIILHTNGLALTEKMAKQIAKFVLRVSLTFDGSNEKMARKMRKNKEIFKQTVFLIKLFNKLSIPTNIKTLITKVNKDDIENIGNIVKNLPIKYWSLLQFEPINRGAKHKDKFFLTTKQFDKITKNIIEKFPALDIRVRKFNKIDRKYCFIAANGKVYTHNRTKGDVLIGDLKNNSLKNILKTI